MHHAQERPNSVDNDQLLATVKSDRHLTTREIAKRFGIHHTTVMDRLKKLGMVKKLDVWVPHKLSEKNIMDRILMCESLLKHNSLDPFLKRIITGDEKWVVYNNIKRRKSWCGPGKSLQTVAKPNLHP
ncbi:histone-lysine N-methyltransferase SETMAR-like [Pseudomyrmex gracilis]|uniref:histone-lysine N-methyltransferase SETMAR-like n=1 Tax=Pseudomyrmex gracilis TaxID=219809 RepID=UPI000995B4FF|nr:histone-lysine N-methyltransferase SETMAR-like [Pseudomyrmex gracilis]